MAKLELTVLFFICISAPAFVSAVTSDKVADILDEGVQMIDKYTESVFNLSENRAQMISKGYRLKQEMAEVSKKLRSGEATKDEAENTLKSIKDEIELVKLIDGIEQDLVNSAKSQIFPLAEKAEKAIKEL